ncbi:MAG: CotH kinase family protein [Fibrobacteria bacterium]|nr:CotH kinase family protein [Fibrobacteria bacterium]
MALPHPRICGLFLLLLVCSCSESTTSVSAPPQAPEPVAIDSTSKTFLAARLFQDDTVRRYDLLLDPESLAVLDADPIAERYVGGTLVVEGDTMRGVGIRYKGNEGAWYGCVENGPWGGGPKVCPLNMKVKVNRTHPDTTFHGLKKFQLHAMNNDPSKMVERIGYWFYRQMGVSAPRVVHVELWINGEYEGLYVHVEEIDGRFTRTHFQDGTGNLYKEIWPLLHDGTAADTFAFMGALHTNEDDPFQGHLPEFSRALAATGSPDSLRDLVERWMIPEEILSLAAVSYALDDDDGPFHWYALDETSPSRARPHNFFWYEEPSTSKIHLVPWDLDHMLRDVATPDTFNAVELRDAFGETSHDCRNYGQDWRQRSAACDKLVRTWASWDELYRSRQRALLEGPFSRISTVLPIWQAQVRKVVERNQDKSPHAPSLAAWEDGNRALESELADARRLLGAQLGL